MSEQGPSKNPYPGLRSFQTDEDYLFFGREDQTAELINRLRDHRFLAVLGTSGSGKSSLVKAGLLPALQGGSMRNAGSSWEIAILRPGADPIHNLAKALLETDMFDEQDGDALIHIKAGLNRSGLGLVDTARTSELEKGANLLIVVDQFEEIFRFREAGSENAESASAFIKLLLESVNQSEVPVYVALTMRSDYMGDCARFASLAEAVNKGKYLIPRLKRTQRKTAITGPAQVAGGSLTERLVQRLLNDVGDDPDQLPILQHALMRTWDQWSRDHQEGEAVDLRHYEAVGKMQEALSLHADEIYSELPDDSTRRITERLFKALTLRGTDQRGVRRPTQLEHLIQILNADSETIARVINAYRRTGRTFLTPLEPVELSSETVIDISHESLMRAWGRLRNWVEEEGQSLRIYRRLTETAELHAEKKAGLYHDPDLQIALSWKENEKPNREWAERYAPGFETAIEFLEKSRRTAQAEAEEKERLRQRELEQAKALAEEKERSAKGLRTLARTLGLAALVTMFLLVLTFNAKKKADESEKLATAERKTAAQARDRLMLRETETFVETPGKSQEALAYYAKLLRDSEDESFKRIVAGRAISLLTQRNFLFPEIAQLTEGKYVRFTQLSQSGHRVLAVTEDSQEDIDQLQVWDSESKELIFNTLIKGPVKLAEFSEEGDLIITRSDVIPEYHSDYTVWSLSEGKQQSEFDIRYSKESSLSDLQSGYLQDLYHFSSDLIIVSERKVSKENAINFLHPGTGEKFWRYSNPWNFFAKGRLDPNRNIFYYFYPGGFSRLDIQQKTDANLKHSFADGYNLDIKIDSTNNRILTRTSWDGTSYRFFGLSDEDPQIEINLEESGEGGEFHDDISKDFKRLAVSIKPMDGSNSRTYVYHLLTNTRLFVIEHDVSVESVHFSPGGSRLATLHQDGSIRIWNAWNGKLIREPIKTDFRSTSFRFQSENRILICATSNNRRNTLLVEIELSSNRLLDERIWKSHNIEHLQYEKGSQTLSWAGKGTFLNFGFSPEIAVESIDLVSGRIKYRASMLGPRYNEFNSYYLNNQDRIISSHNNNYIWIRDLNSNTSSNVYSVRTRPGGNENRTARFSSDGKLIGTFPISSNNQTIEVEIIDTQSGELISNSHYQVSVNDLQFSADGKYYVVALKDRTARIIGTDSGHENGEPFVHDEPVNVSAFSPNGQFLATGAGVKFHYWNIEEGSKTGHRLDTLEPIQMIHFSPHGELLAVATRHWIYLWNQQLGFQMMQPVYSENSITSIAFNSNGSRLAIANSSNNLKSEIRLLNIFDSDPGKLPEFPDFLERIAGRHIDKSGTMGKGLTPNRLSLRDNISTFKNTGYLGHRLYDYINIGFDKNIARESSPGYSKRAEQIAALVKANTARTLREVLDIDPENPVALAKLSTQLLRPTSAKKDQEVSPQVREESAWAIARALSLAPDNAEVWRNRAETFLSMGNTTEALQAIRTATSLDSENSLMYVTQGRILQNSGNPEEAIESWSKALALEIKKNPEPSNEKNEILRNRMQAFENVGKTKEAHADLKALAGISIRQSGLSKNHLDLTDFYTGSLTNSLTLGNLIRGDLDPGDTISDFSDNQSIQDSGISFDLRGVIELGDSQTSYFPKEKNGIPIVQKAQSIHFLHTAQDGRPYYAGTAIAEYVIHYESGKTLKIPVMYGSHVRDWFSIESEPMEADDATLINIGTNVRSTLQGRTLRGFIQTWKNPHPELMINSVDIVSAEAESRLVVFAITVEE